VKSSAVRVLPLILVLVTVTACGKKEDTASPVAKPTVTLSKAKTPLGSPIEIKYRFDVAANASFKQDYRVLVHFLDADDELMWTDDHNPPVPTSQWKPGQVVEYTRLVFVPVFPYVGKALVTIGLYAPGGNERLPLQGDPRGQREYRAATLELQPQFDGILVVYKDGWHPAETVPDSPGLEWQWTKKDATLSFRNPKTNATLLLHCDGQPKMAGSPQTVTLLLHGEVIDTFRLTDTKEEIRRIPIKAAQFGNDDLVEIQLQVDKTFVPSLLGIGSRDPRELGIRVYHAYVEPQ
jgi:hypothetical protein